jgi:2-polyprenyl-3-methyl-5-hydroxy-6-metoxy-1,4-benzoquinol methylase
MCKLLPTRKLPRLTRKYAALLLGLKDYSLHSGERQTATLLDGIRRDHVWRYQVTIDILKAYYGGNKPIKGYDVFCGIGYGAYMLSSDMPNVSIEAVDGSEDAIKLAQEYYQTGKITFSQKFFPFTPPPASADFFVSLESLEHIENDDLFINVVKQTLLEKGIFIVSTPNVEKWQLETNANHFHYKHYKPAELIDKMNEFGFKFIRLYGQDIYKMDAAGKIAGLLNDSDMELKPDYQGQCCVYIFKKL